MIGASLKLNPQTSTDMSSVTFSAALAAGLTHYDWLGGRKTDPSLREVALASHSVSPGKGKDSQMNDTCGPLFAGLSPSADLQRSLGSRLRQRMEGYGSPEYVLTWKRWDMLSGEPICALRASGRRTSGKDFGGWPTTRRTDGEKGTRTNEGAYRERMRRKNGYDLPSAVDLAGWPTPNQNTTGPGNQGREGGENLQTTVLMAGWQTPKAHDGEFSTPRTSGRPIEKSTHLQTQAIAVIAGWKTPHANKTTDENQESWEERHQKGDVATMPAQMAAQLTGPSQSGGPAGMEKSDVSLRLNPAFSLWLMGYPLSWAMIGMKALLKTKAQYEDYRKALLRSLEE